MIGGGQWRSQNKVLNGAYINFVSNVFNVSKRNSANADNEPSDDVTSSVMFFDHGNGLVTTKGITFVTDGNGKVWMTGYTFKGVTI
jgi:hypothetical protein